MVMVVDEDGRRDQGKRLVICDTANRFQMAAQASGEADFTVTMSWAKKASNGPSDGPATPRPCVH